MRNPDKGIVICYLEPLFLIFQINSMPPILPLHPFQFGKILAINEADRPLGLIHHNKIINGLTVKKVERLHSQRIVVNGDWILGHDPPHRRVQIIVLS